MERTVTINCRNAENDWHCSDCDEDVTKIPPHLRSFKTSIRTEGEALHNFGPVSFRDDIVFTAERPGNPPKKTDKVPMQKVEDWVVFMKANGITDVIALLDDNEVGIYPTPPGLLNLYRQGGLVPHQVSMSSPDAPKQVFSVLDDAFLNDSKVVVHCTGGVGRAGRVAAAWLMYKYDVTAKDATSETIQAAELERVRRKGSVERLEAWMENA